VRSLLFVVVASMLFTACTDDTATVLVDLKTDLVAGAEFSAVQTLLEGTGAPIETPALLGDDFVDGRRVAELNDLTPGRHVVVVTLVAADRTPITERRFRLDVSESIGLTALLTRDCRTVRCGGGETCVAGTCVSDDCVNAGDPNCPMAECTSVTALTACPGASACAEARCDLGACLYASLGTCGGGEYCSPEDGCLPVPDDIPPDAGPPGSLSPLASFSGAPNDGGAEGEVMLSYALPADVGGAVRLDFLRVAGASAPADCTTGDVAASVTDFMAPGSVVDRIDDRWNRVHSYRACFFDVVGGSLSDATMIAEGVTFENPGPGCHHPPCENVDSTVPTTGLPQPVASRIATTGFTGGDIRLTDFDDDGNLDVVVAAQGVNFAHLGGGDGTFGPPIPLGADSAESFATATGDFDNDGNVDVVFANRDAPSMVHLGGGDGTFDGGSAVYPDSFPAIFDVETADLNGDTFLDLVFTSFADVDRIYLGDGTGAFTFLALLKPDMNESCVNCMQLVDIDGDDIVDIALAYNGGTTRMDIFIGNGDATFQPATPIPFDSSLTPISVRLSDFDNDGQLDLVVGKSSGGGIWAATGSGDGLFSRLTEVASVTRSRSYGLWVSDFDGDGDDDIMFSHETNGVVGFLGGNGDGTFQTQVDLDGGSTHSTTSLEAGDLNGDGKLDFVAGNASGNSLVFLGM